MLPIIAYHLTFTTYGFWLPNDPRGSGSRVVWSEPLAAHGAATFVADRRRSRARCAHDPAVRVAAQADLKHPPVLLDAARRAAVRRGLTVYTERTNEALELAAVLKDHVHVLVHRGARQWEQIEAGVKAKATLAMSEGSCHPFQPDGKGRRHTPWAENGWCTYLHNDEDVERTRRYIRKNLARAGLSGELWQNSV